jgi:hypothetical protein
LVQSELASLGQQAKQLTSELDALAGMRAEWELSQLRLADLELWCRNVAANVDEMTYDQKRIALHALSV